MTPIATPRLQKYIAINCFIDVKNGLEKEASYKQMAPFLTSVNWSEFLQVLVIRIVTKYVVINYH